MLHRRCVWYSAPCARYCCRQHNLALSAAKRSGYRRSRHTTPSHHGAIVKKSAIHHAPCPTSSFLYTNYESADEVLADAGDWHGAIPTVMSMTDVFFGHNGFVWNEKVQTTSAV